MKKIQLVLGFAFYVLGMTVCGAECRGETANSAETGVEMETGIEDSFFRSGYIVNEVKRVELKTEDDVLDAGTDIKPLAQHLSASEGQQEDSSDFDYIKEDNEKIELPDLPCNDPKLKKQVESFIMNSLRQKEAHSVLEKRKRLLMVRGMPDFEDVTGQKINSEKNFMAASADAYLRINERRTIKHICKSSNPEAMRNFNDVYVIIYPYLNFYKIVVPNLMPSNDALEEATFIYNW